MSSDSGGRGLELGAGTGDRGLQLLAAALVVGGAIGIVIVLSVLSQGGSVSVLTPIVLVSLALFGACVWAGWALWRGHRRGKQLATLLYALQIPFFSAAGVTYQFFTVAALRFAVTANGDLSGSVEMGAFLTLILGGSGFRFLGVNILAVGAVWYLLQAD